MLLIRVWKRLTRMLDHAISRHSTGKSSNGRYFHKKWRWEFTFAPVCVYALSDLWGDCSASMDGQLSRLGN